MVNRCQRSFSVTGDGVVTSLAVVSFIQAFSIKHCKFVVAVAGGVAVLSGCASTAQKNLMVDLDKADRAYAVVSKKRSADNWRFRRNCRNGNTDPTATFACEKPDDFEFLTIWYMASNRFIGSTVLAPKSQNVEEGNFIRVNPQKRYGGYEEIASRTATADCHWEGTPLWVHNSSFLGALTGTLFPPAALSIFYDGWMLSGVECEGWSYKTYWEQAKSAKRDTHVEDDLSVAGESTDAVGHEK